MKNIICTVFLFSALVTFLGSCKKTDSNSKSVGNYTALASFVIDGGSFQKQMISIKGSMKTTTHCNYSTSDRTTNLTINDQPDINTSFKNQFFLICNGNAPATQHSGDNTNGGSFNSIYFQVSVTDKEGNLHNYLFEDAENTPGEFTITKYGKVGETVEGSFSGILVDEDGVPGIKISSGTFSITRDNDM